MKLNKSAAIGILVIGVACVFAWQRLALTPWLGALGVVMGWFGLTAFLRRAEGDRNRKAIQNALSNLDVIRSGLRIIGRDADAVDWRRADLPNEPGPIEVVQLCRTQKGQWFEHSFSISRDSRVYGNRVRLLDEREARAWMSYDVKAYERVFGQAEVA